MEIATVAGWQSVEFEDETGYRNWVQVHEACLDAAISRRPGELSDVDGVLADIAEAEGLRCWECGS